jgi:hypothetical protein
MMPSMSAWWSAAPVLPAPWVAQIGMSTLWGVVLAWCAMALALRLRPALNVRERWTLVLAVMALSWWPGTASPAYWLGLSFQSPSLALGWVAAYGLWVQMLPAAGKPGPWAAGSPQITWLCALGVALGWVLMLDTLAMWPRSVYAMGFDAAALVVVGLTLVILGLWRAGLPAVLLAAVLLMFALTRLPTGNVWDALSDPLLWAGLHFKLMRDVLAQRSANKHISSSNG